MWTKALDKKFRDLYTVAAKVVNDVSEAGNGYRRVAMALDLRQQVIVRKSGPFVKATTSAAPVRVRQLKPGSHPVPSCAQSLATQAKKKNRSRGRGRSALGLPPHPAPPPRQPSPAPSHQAPAPPRFQSRDIRVRKGQL